VFPGKWRAPGTGAVYDFVITIAVLVLSPALSALCLHTAPVPDVRHFPVSYAIYALRWCTRSTSTSFLGLCTVLETAKRPTTLLLLDSDLISYTPHKQHHVIARLYRRPRYCRHGLRLAPPCQRYVSANLGKLSDGGFVEVTPRRSLCPSRFGRLDTTSSILDWCLTAWAGVQSRHRHLRHHPWVPANPRPLSVWWRDWQQQSCGTVSART